LEIILLKKLIRDKTFSGIWFFEDGWVIVNCPKCGQSCAVSKNNDCKDSNFIIDLEGHIDPKLECPGLICKESSYFKLENWNGYRT